MTDHRSRSRPDPRARIVHPRKRCRPPSTTQTLQISTTLEPALLPSQKDQSTLDRMPKMQCTTPWQRRYTKRKATALPKTKATATHSMSQESVAVTHQIPSYITEHYHYLPPNELVRLRG